MFGYILVGSSDLLRSKKFYDAVLGELGVPAATEFNGRYVWKKDGNVFVVGHPISGSATHANGGTIGFTASSISQVTKAWIAGMRSGGVECEDPPGFRGEQPYRKYMAYIRDPDFNKLSFSVKV